MQIDSIELQKPKADAPIDRRFECGSNSTVLSRPFENEQYGPSSSIEAGIRIDSGDPITQRTDRISKSTNNSFTTLNETDPFAIAIELIRLLARAVGWIAVTEAGIKSRFNDRQPKNASFSIVASLGGGSNITD
jgi:hypothetical protein